MAPLNSGRFVKPPRQELNSNNQDKLGKHALYNLNLYSYLRDYISNAL